MRETTKAMTLKQLMLTLIVMTLLSGSFTFAGEIVNRPTRGAFGLKVGMISRSEISGDFHASTELGSTAQVFADHPLGKNIYFSTAFDFYYIQILRSNQVMFEGSVGIKWVNKLKNSTISFVPGFSAGFTRLARVGALSPTEYLTIKGMVEARFSINRKKAWIVELAVLRSPTGGNDNLNLTFGPTYMLRAGVIFR